MKEIEINKEKYFVNDDEFNVIDNEKYKNLYILNDVKYVEKIASFISNLSHKLGVEHLVLVNCTLGGFLSFEILKYVNMKIYISSKNIEHKKNIELNLKKYNNPNIFLNYNVVLQTNYIQYDMDSKHMYFINPSTLNNNSNYDDYDDELPDLDNEENIGIDINFNENLLKQESVEVFRYNIN